jgi:hypothetical protein
VLRCELGEADLYVADLADIIRSKKAAGRPRDKGVLGLLEKTREEIAAQSKSQTRSPKKQR